MSECLGAGNNFPVFFVRDGMKFPDMVHALKPNPKNHLQEGWRIADFFSHHPESMHMVGCRPLYQHCIFFLVSPAHNVYDLQQLSNVASQLTSCA